MPFAEYSDRAMAKKPYVPLRSPVRLSVAAFLITRAPMDYDRGSCAALCARRSPAIVEPRSAPGLLSLRRSRIRPKPISTPRFPPALLIVG